MGRKAKRKTKDGPPSSSEREEDATVEEAQQQEQCEPSTTMRKTRAALAPKLVEIEDVSAKAADKVAPDESDSELEPEVEPDSSASTDFEEELHPAKGKGHGGKHASKVNGRKVRFVPLNEFEAADDDSKPPSDPPPPPQQAVIPLKDGSQLTISARAFADIVSAYNVLRAFSWQLRLSPFSIEVSTSNGVDSTMSLQCARRLR